MKRILPIFFFLLYNQISFAQWIRSNGLESMAVQHLAVLDTSIFAVIGPVSGSFPTDKLYTIYRSSDNGSSWENTGLDGRINDFVVSGSKLIVSVNDGYEGTLKYAAANDTIWTSAEIETGTVWCLTVSNQYVYGGIQSNVLISTDNGANWSATGDEFCDRGIFSIAVLDTLVFAAAWASPVVYRSNNNGETWSDVGDVPSLGPEWQMFASGNNLLASSINGGDVYLSDDKGATWSMVLSMTNSVNSFWGCDFVHIEEYGFVSGGEEVFLSIDHGYNWINVTDDLMDISYVSSFAVLGTNLFVGTDNGVWYRSLSEMITDVKTTNELPKNYTLEQNFPNPFTLKTVISYKLSANSEVQLGVYDLMGRNIATIINERQQAGKYEVEWNASENGHGIYICELKVGQSRRVIKMILLE